MRKSGMEENYVQLVQDMYEKSETAVTCAVGTREISRSGSEYTRNQH